VTCGYVGGLSIYLTPGTSTYFRSQSTLSLSATTQAQFVTQRDALRASGTATTFVRWDRIVPLYATGTTDGTNSIQLKTAEDSMKALGIKPLIVMTRSPASYTWPASPAANSAADWQDRWLAWQQWYAQAFVHAQYNDVENFQFFNEPDLYASSNGTLTQDQWLEMVRFGANAVESAIADVNRLYGKSLTPHVYGPVTTGPETAAGGWGDLLLRNRSNQLITGSSSSYRLFDHYDYHNYGSSPTTFGTKVADTIAAINAMAMLLEHSGQPAAAARIDRAVAHVTGTKMKSQAAGKMGYGTKEIGDLVVAALA
jgi:hypothetical protein